MGERYDIAVIGAGMVGVSTALHLLMRGKKTILIDRRGPGEETSYGNAGLIETSCVLPYSFPNLSRIPNILLDRDTMARIDYAALPKLLPWLIRLYFESQDRSRLKNGKLVWPLVKTSLDEHRALMRNTDAERHLRVPARIALCRTEASFAATSFERQVASEWGVPFEVMDPRSVEEIEPDLHPTAYHKAIIWTGSGRVDNPGAVTNAYADRFTKEGGVFQRAEAKTLTPSGNEWNVTTSSGDITASQIVICTGPWAMDILRPLGYRFPLGFKRGYHKHFTSVGGAKLSHTIVDREYGFLIAPMEQGYRITTGAEFADRDAPPNPVQIDRILPHARQLFPLGEPVETTAWLGSRPCFVDSLPVISPASRHAGLWFNIGHGHMGLTMGPSSGRLLTEMITGGETFCDPYPYRATRFGG